MKKKIIILTIISLTLITSVTAIKIEKLKIDPKNIQAGERINVTVKAKDTKSVKKIKLSFDNKNYTKNCFNKKECSKKWIFIPLKTKKYHITAWAYHNSTKISKPKKKTINIEKSKDHILIEKGIIKITKVDHKIKICQKEDLNIKINLKNYGNEKEVVKTIIKTKYTTKKLPSILLNPGETQTLRTKLENLQNKGEQRLTVKLKNKNAKTIKKFKVKECKKRIQTKTGETTQPAIYLTETPNKIISGENINLKGFIETSKIRNKVEINLNSKTKTTVQTEPDGYFSTYLKLEKVGINTITVKSNNMRKTKRIEVLPTATIRITKAPRKVFENQKIKLCTHVNSQIKPEIVLIEKKEVLQVKKGKGKVCFNIKNPEPGEHEYTIRAITKGTGDHINTKIKVLPISEEAESFPDNIASIESGSGLVKVELYNTNNKFKEYQIKLEGLPKNWTSTQQKKVRLNIGEKEKIFFYITPEEEGTFTPNLTVKSNGSILHKKELEIISGGTIKKQDKKGILEKISNYLHYINVY